MKNANITRTVTTALSGPPSDGLSPVVESSWEPSARDWQYLRAVKNLIEADGRLSDATIGNQLGITKQGVAKMEKRPGFRVWLNQQLDAATAHRWPLVLHRATVLALRGSIDHMNFLAKIRGAFRQLEGTPPAEKTTLVVEIRQLGADRTPDGLPIPALRVEGGR